MRVEDSDGDIYFDLDFQGHLEVTREILNGTFIFLLKKWDLLSPLESLMRVLLTLEVI